MNKSIKFFPILSVIIFLLSFSIVFAADAFKAPVPEVPIGDESLNLSAINCTTDAVDGKCTINWLSQYVAVIFEYGMTLAVTLTILMMMIGGLIWMMSGGSSDKVGVAKEFITSALLGLMLALFSYLILYTINPRLTVLESLSINVPQLAPEPEEEDGEQKPEGWGCCLISSHQGGSSPTITCTLYDDLSTCSGSTYPSQECSAVEACQ